MKPIHRAISRRRAGLCILGAAAGSVLGVSSAFAQAFPSKPIVLVVGLGAGGGTDIQARALARAASEVLGQPIVIENRPGLSATLGPASVAQRSPPDGYSIAVIAATLFRVPHLTKVTYDPMKDFTYIANVTSYSYSLSVAPDSRFKSLKELIAHAQANPAGLTYSTTGPGGTGHVTAARLAKLTGANFTMVPFRSSSEAFTAVMAGHVDFTCEAAFGAFLDGGKVRSLGVFSDQRLKSRPSIPTLREQGYDVVAKSSWGIGGPRGMDPKVVAALQEAFHKAMADPAFLKILDQNDQPATYMDSAAYTAYAAQLMAEEGRFVRELGIKLE